jgi:hypothetical protein
MINHLKKASVMNLNDLCEVEIGEEPSALHEAKSDLDITHKLDGLSVRLKFNGTAGKVNITGRMRPFFLGLDPLNKETISDSITVNREDRPGKKVPYGAYNAVVDEIISYIKSNFKKQLSS